MCLPGFPAHTLARPTCAPVDSPAKPLSPPLHPAPLQRDDVLDWPREFPKRIPQQQNGCDCGVFTLLFANYAGRAAPLAFDQASRLCRLQRSNPSVECLPFG